ncbi:MAG TPA: hypothetical protein VGF67_20070 [Ktedonobacteraceae bacterium]|jgi:hypothetical protein
MSQQHTRFEEEFRDGPPPAGYQAVAAGGQPMPGPAFQTYTALAGQKLEVPLQDTEKTPGPGQRLALAIVSLVFVFLTFMVTLGVVAAVRDDLFPLAPLAVAFALIFAVVTLLLNILFSRKH